MTESVLLGRIAGTPWAMLPAALQTLVEVAARDPVTPENLDRWKALMAPATAGRDAVAFRAAAALPGAARAQMRDGIAILNVTGPVFRYANLFTEMSGATSLATLAADLQLAADDPRVKGLLLNLDSPGGQATGLTEVGDAIRRVSASKPVVAYVDGVAASAAYLLAAAASRIVLAREATVGSLGIVGMFPPKGEAARQPVEIVSSQTPNKRASPHNDEGRAKLQAWIDDSAAVFLDAVAEYRGMTVEALLDATDGGGLLVGAKAVEAGLADATGTFEGTFAELASGASPALPRRSRRALAAQPLDPTGGPMADSTVPATPPVAAADPAPLPTPEPAPAPLAAAPVPQPDPVAAERVRVGAILAAQKPGMQALAQLAVAQGWTAEVFAEAQQAAGTAAVAAAREAFAGSLPAPVATGPAPDLASLPPEQRAEAEWNGSPKIREEFGTLGAFVAFTKAQAQGRVRMLSRPAA